MVVISDQWSMTWATDPTVISDPGENVTGHRWAKLGPQMGHKAKRRPCGRRSTTLSYCFCSIILVARAGFEPATFGL